MPSFFGLMSGSQGSTAMPSSDPPNPEARLMSLGYKQSTEGLSDDEKLEQQALKRRVTQQPTPEDGD